MSKEINYSLAIDFGTTNLKVASYENKKVTPQKLSNNINGKRCEPNIITRNKRKDGNYEFEIGSAAENLLYDIDADKMKFVYNVKRHLCEENWNIKFHDGYEADAVELSGEIFSWIYNRMVTKKGGNIPNTTVITFPVMYSEMQINRIKKAAKLAKINVDAVISEPVAAFFSFEETKDFFEDADDGDEKNFFIFDFGGGTIDAAVIKIKCIDDNFKVTVLSSYGIKYGGSDLTESIINDIIFPSVTPNERKLLKERGYHFVHEIDNKKVRMYSDEDDEVDDEYYIKRNNENIDINYHFTSDEIEDILNKNSLKEKLVKMFDYMLEESDIYKDEDEISVHFIGGGSGIPYFRNILEEYFETDEIGDFDEDENMGYVALGAAYYAGMLSENTNIKFENRSAYQIVGEFENTGVYLNRQTLYENKTIKKPLTLTKFDDGRRYMKFYQKFTPKSEKIYLGYLDLSDSKYDTAEVFDLKICYDGRIEAEVYGHKNESLGKENIIVEEI